MSAAVGNQEDDRCGTIVENESRQRIEKGSPRHDTCTLCIVSDARSCVQVDLYVRVGTGWSYREMEKEESE